MQVAVGTGVFLKLHVSKSAGAATRVDVKTGESDDEEGRIDVPKVSFDCQPHN